MILAKESNNGLLLGMVKLTPLLRLLHLTLFWLGLSLPTVAGEVTVAVASNFLTTAEKIAEGFSADTGHQVHIVNGSTGTLYAQIINGAPYDLFLSADQDRVLALADAGRLLEGHHKPYALGHLVLYAAKTGVLTKDIQTSLATEAAHHFAMADPALAPYGRAASQVLAHLEVSNLIRQKAVLGANIGQTFGFVKTGNAPMGFVARAQVVGQDGDWLQVPSQLHAPIIQEVGVLAYAQGNDAALAFYDHLSRPAVQAILPEFGYSVPE